MKAHTSNDVQINRLVEVFNLKTLSEKRRGVKKEARDEERRMKERGDRDSRLEYSRRCTFPCKHTFYSIPFRSMNNDCSSFYFEEKKRRKRGRWRGTTRSSLFTQLWCNLLTHSAGRFECTELFHGKRTQHERKDERRKQMMQLNIEKRNWKDYPLSSSRRLNVSQFVWSIFPTNQEKPNRLEMFQDAIKSWMNKNGGSNNGRNKRNDDKERREERRRNGDENRKIKERELIRMRRKKEKIALPFEDWIRTWAGHE